MKLKKQRLILKPFFFKNPMLILFVSKVVTRVITNVMNGDIYMNGLIFFCNKTH